MKKFCRKGHLKRSGKRWLALLMSVCLIGTMIPITARAENGSSETGLCEHHTEHTPECGYVAPAWGHECEHEHDESCGYQEASECNHVHTEECGENGENCTHVHTSECGYAEGHACEHVHDEECGYAEASEGSPCTFVCGKKAEPGENNLPDETLTQTLGKLITTWQWIDEEEYLDEETGNLALPGASEQTPAYFDDVTAFLPTQIQATVEDADNSENPETGVEEIITLGDWTCDNYPVDGAYSGIYTFTATLPEGYALSEEAEKLTITVELGGAQMYGTVASISYLDKDGNTQTCADATEVTDADTAWGTSATDTWYVVNGTMVIGSLSSRVRISVSGNVRLILTDGCSLTINGGIEVADGNSLTIYGQTGGTGSLSIQNVETGNAGIGSAKSTKCGTITINGGKVTAKSGSAGAGIGSGSQGEGGTITINGGTVTATGNGYSAGIGGGQNKSGGTITINGGTVTATGGNSGGAGIGGGQFGDGGSITINGGTVTATCGNSGGAGIGGGRYAGGGNIAINGGTVTATGGTYGGAGIGGGAGGASGAGGSGGTISISGGTVTATGGTEGGAGIGGGGYSSGTGGSGGSIDISGGNVTATGGADGGAGIGDGINGSGGTVAISNSFVMAGSISDTSSQNSWSGLIFEGDTGKAYGTSVNVTTDCTIPSGKTLEVATGQTISIADTKTLTNEGTIYNSGTFTGAVTNSGTIHNAGTISGASGGTIKHYSISTEPTETSCQLVGLSLKVNDTTFEGTVTYTLSDSETNAVIENGNTLKVTDSGVGTPIPVTATFTVDSVSMTRTENVTIRGHVLKYAVNSQTTGTSSIKVTCGDCGKEYGTVTLSAPTENLTYDGNAKTASVTNNVTGVTISNPDITYKQDGNTLLSAPKDAGTYTASITLGDATVSVEFTIEKATPELGTVSVTSLNNTLNTSEVVFSRTNSTVAGTFALTDVTKLQYGTHDYSYVFTPTGTDEVNYKPVEGTVSITVNDTIAPTAEYQIGENGWKKFVNTISFGLFCKDYKTVKITYSDVAAEDGDGTSSGVKTGQYYIANKELTNDDIEALQWNDYTNAISLNAEGVYVIYVKVEDNAGNSVVFNSEGIVIYAESALSPTSMDYTYKENRDLEVQITMNGNTFGKLTDGEGTEIATSNYEIDASGKLTLKKAYLDTLDVGQYTYKVSMNPQGQVTDTVTLEYSFVVNVKAQELTVTGATATDRVYDTTNVVAITEVTLSGVKNGETVSVDTTNLTGTLSSANVGAYTSVTLPTLTLTGADAGNYTLVQPTGAVPTTVTMTISKADAAINVGTESYDKTFGDADFTLDVTDTNSEADVQCTVTTGNDVISVSNKTVTILKAGTATITVSLPASTNYNAAADQTITVTVAKKSGYTVADINKSYLYSRDNEDTIDLSKYLPANCGTVTYGTAQTSGTVEYTVSPAVADGKLSYTVKQAETYGATGTIQVTVTTDNYADFTITVNVKLIDQIPVSLKEGSSVTLQNSTLTYGQALSTLTFNSAVFVDAGGNVVTGTLAWKTPDEKPNAGTTSATWVFTPNDASYATLEDTVAITVNKATPQVTNLPTVAARTYNPTVSLTNSDLTGGTVSVAGGWSWQTANIIPTVNNSGYVAVFTPEDTTNYETVTRTITVTVTKATPYIETAPTAAAITYGDTLGASTLSGGTVQYSSSDATTVAGSFAWKDSSVKPSVSDSNSTTYWIVFTPSDADNYNTVETDITLTVNKAENAPNMPSSTMNVANSCEKVSDVTLPTGWVWQDADKNTELTVGTAVTATAEYNGADKGNYENETVSVTITRSACDHAHTEVRNAKAATCKETGYTGDTYCKDCGELLTTGTTIPLADHQGGTATCTKKAVCTVCGQEYGELDANNHVHTEIRGAVAATCTAGGYTGDTYCTDCGVKTKTGTATPALGHNYTSKVTTEPTTDREGVRTYTCDRCGHSYTESIPKLPEEEHQHSYSDSVTKEPTCTDTGIRTYTCSCGDSYTETIPALGHNYTSKVTTEPTTSSEGVMTYTCERCGHSYTRAIAKLQDNNNNNPTDNNPGENNPGENQPGGENTPDIGKPYIKDETGKEGWEVIKAEVDKTQDGDSIVVEMNGSSVVPGDVLDEIKGKDVTIVFEMGNGITWSVNGQSITSDKIGDIDFSVKIGTTTIPVDVINNVTGERYSQQISLAYDGEFGFTAVLSINMEASNAGLYANLFYFNEKTGELEFICADEIAEDGTAELTFTHASDYVIAIDTEPMDKLEQVTEPESESQSTEAESTQTGAEVSNDAWNPWWIIVIGIMVIVIGLGVFLVAKKKKSEDE